MPKKLKIDRLDRHRQTKLKFHAENNHDNVAENNLPTVAPVSLAVDKQIDEEPIVIEFDDSPSSLIMMLSQTLMKMIN